VEKPKTFPDNKLVDPSKIKFKKKAYCKNHDKECALPDPEDLLLILGSPCVLFSKSPNCSPTKFWFVFLFRGVDGTFNKW